MRIKAEIKSWLKIDLCFMLNLTGHWAGYRSLFLVPYYYILEGRLFVTLNFLQV